VAAFATVPVIKGLTKRSHPCQVMADVMTSRSLVASIGGRTGRGTATQNNVLASGLQAADRFKFPISGWHRGRSSSPRNGYSIG